MRFLIKLTELAGNIEGIGLARLIKLLSDIRASGALSLEEAPFTGRLTFDEGQVYGAKFGTEEGMAALEAIALALRTPASFSFTSASPKEPELRNLDLDGETVIREFDQLGRGLNATDASCPRSHLCPYPSGRVVRKTKRFLSSGARLTCCWTATAVRPSRDLVQRGSMLNTLKRLSRLIELGLIECRPMDRSHSPSGRHETGTCPVRGR